MGAYSPNTSTSGAGAPACPGSSVTAAPILGHRFGQGAVFAWTKPAWRLLPGEAGPGIAVRGWWALLHPRPPP